MNHHYPDGYYGYPRAGHSVQDMAYGQPYSDPAAMVRMGHPRENYHVPNFCDTRQMNPIVDRTMMYNQQNENSYRMADYGAYGMHHMNPSMINNRENNMSLSYYRPSGMPELVQRPDQHSNMHASSSAYSQSLSHTRIQQHQQPHMGAALPRHSHPIIPNQSTMPSVSNQVPSQPSQNQSTHCSPKIPGRQMSQATPLPPAGASYGPQGSQILSPAHHIPQHPMRHPSSQQNPQEVADNILQMASSFPSNQTVQVPLKSRPAPYHIPRSPHYSVHSDVSHMASISCHQQQSPVQMCHTSPSPTASSVKSPTPVLAPIPNPIPSPGIRDLRSPCNQGHSPCGAQPSPAHMGSSYSGHSQGRPPPQLSNHVSSNSQNSTSSSDVIHQHPPGNITTGQNYATYPSASTSNTIFSSHNESSNNNHEPRSLTDYNNCVSSSPKVHSLLHSGSASVKQNEGNHHIFFNNPLMSLEKLVMLPETQVIDPKSVVNDACMTAQQNDQGEGPKNVEDPAERLFESSSLSVGCQNQSSSHAFKSNPLDAANNKTADTRQIEGVYDQVNDYTTFETNKENNSCTDVITDSFDSHITSNAQDTENVPVLSKNEPELEKVLTESNMENGKLVPDVNKLSQDMHFALDKVLSLNSIDVNKVPLQVQVKEEDAYEVDSGISEPEVSQNKEIVLFADSLDGSTENEKYNNVKCPMLHRRAPGVLSEVPVLTNGIDGAICNTEVPVLEDFDKELLSHVSKGLKSFRKHKINLKKKIAPIIRMTPCSIAVGVNQRDSTERFAFRRNRILRNIRTAGIISHRRNRSYSLGNGDSDESLESLSDSNMVSGVPQDGNRKKTASSKRSEYKTSCTRSVNSSNRVVENGSKASDSIGNSNGIASYNNAVVSDDEMSYYEGVDNTDIFVSNFSSDESLNSSTEIKLLPSPRLPTSPDLKADKDEQKILEAKTLQIAEEQDTEIENPSPASKKLKLTKAKSSEDLLTRDKDKKVGIKNESLIKVDKVIPVLQSIDDGSSLNGENETNLLRQVTLSSTSKTKYPVVLLEKSKEASDHLMIKTSYSDLFEQSELNTKIRTEDAEINQEILETKVESYEDITTTDSKTERYTEVKVEALDNNVLFTAEVDNGKINRKPSVRKPFRKRGSKTKTLRGKNKKKPESKLRKKSEIADSFKSLKFNRTLNMIKSVKRREPVNNGPFIRIKGKKSRPNLVSVFQQSQTEVPALSAKHYGNLKKKQSQVIQPANIVHIVTNLPSEKSAMVPLSRTIEGNIWACAFCGHHSSYKFMGDLFGPYYRDSDLGKVEKFAADDSRQCDPNNRDKRLVNFGANSRRQKDVLIQKKCKSNLKSTVKQAPEEVWVHEACAMWSPGVYLVGGKLFGLDDAIKDAEDSMCSVCKRKGAMVGCLHKGCTMKFHVVCAIERECYMDEENLSLLCPKHKDKKLNTSLDQNKS